MNISINGSINANISIFDANIGAIIGSIGDANIAANAIISDYSKLHANIGVNIEDVGGGDVNISLSTNINVNIEDIDINIGINTTINANIRMNISINATTNNVNISSIAANIGAI